MGYFVMLNYLDHFVLFDPLDVAQPQIVPSTNLCEVKSTLISFRYSM